MPAHPPRPENSAAGLVLLDAEVRVVVTGEESYQAALRRYAPGADGRPRQLAAALCPAPAREGRQAGQPGVDVLLDGERIGALTPRMAQRYLPVIHEVLWSGGQPGCLARVTSGPRGLQVELRLPEASDRGADPAGTTGAAPRADRPGRPARPPAGPLPPRRPGGPPAGRRSRAPLWIGAGVGVALLVVGGSLSSGNRPTTTDPVSAAAQESAGTSPTPTPTPTLAAAEATVGDLPPVRYTAPSPPAAPAPAAQPTTRRPTSSPASTRAERTTTPKPVAQAESGGGCDPNYSGCVPIASDVDCAGGSGNGPKYVRGPLDVIGSDIYGLDNDKDGIACE